MGKEIQLLENKGWSCQGQIKVALSSYGMGLFICRGKYDIVAWVSLALWVGRIDLSFRQLRAILLRLAFFFVSPF